MPKKTGGLRRALAYGASLPERTVRAAAVVVGGASRLATDTALPRSFRRTRLYRFLMGNFQRFLIEQVGRVQGTYRGFKEKLPKDFLARKTVGDVVEAAGIVALAYSPLWFFALLSGAAVGSRTFLDRVVRELKKDGTLPRSARITSAEELLKALERASLATTIPFDQPPLSFRHLGELRRRIAADYKSLFAKSRRAVPDAVTLWNVMNRVRKEQGITLLELSGLMTLEGARAARRATGALFREKVLRSYAESIEKVRRSGFAPFFSTAARPYFRAVAGAFEPRSPTLTEKLLIRRR